MFWKKTMESTELVKEILHSLEIDPDSWGNRWNHNKDIYAFTRKKGDSTFFIYFDGKISITYEGSLISDPNEKSTGTLEISLTEPELKQISDGIKKLIKYKAITHLKKEQPSPKQPLCDCGKPIRQKDEFRCFECWKADTKDAFES